MNIKIVPQPNSRNNKNFPQKSSRQQKISKQKQNLLGQKQRTNSCTLKDIQIQDNKLSYNFTVAVRVKPKLLTQTNTHHNSKISQSINYSSFDEQSLVVQYPQNYSSSYSLTKNRKFNFDKVFIDKNNKTIYDNFIKSKVCILKQNMNLTILTYGITGSGKTYTIFGNSEHKEEGLAMLCFKDIIKEYKTDPNMQFSLSYLQIYNEQVHDLLKDCNRVNNQQPQQNNILKLKPLNVMEDSKGKVKIPQLSKIQIGSAFQIQDLIQKGNLVRACSSNLINTFSSRSHALIQLYCYNKKTKIQNMVTIIDLAGSERHVSVNNGHNRQKSKQKQNLQKQGSNINRSLLALGNCLKGLQNNQSHIPYRDSKLTRILKQDLSGKAHNIMIACVGRNFSQSEETMNTLQYAQKAAKIKVQKIKNCSDNDRFQCLYCFKQLPWKDILQKVPQKFSSMYQDIRLCNQEQKKFIKPQLQNKKYKNQNKLTNTNVSQKLNQLKNEISGLINRTFNQIQREVSHSLDQSVNCLFPCQQKLQNFIIERKNIQIQITELFRIYQSQIQHTIYKQNQNFYLKQDQTLNSQESLKKNRAISQNFQRQRFFKNNQFIQPTNCNSQTTNGLFSKTIALMNLDKNFNLQSFREQTIGKQNQTGSNLRKKLSIKNVKGGLNSANTTNATLDELNCFNNSFESGKNIQIQQHKTQRMKPDTDEQIGFFQRITYKSAIMKKIEEAKKKYENIDLEFAHQNCSRFEQEDANEIQKNRKKLKLEIQRQRNFVQAERDERNQIYVSSFMDDSNQFDAIC